MAISNYRPSRDEIELAAIWEKIDEVDELIAELEKQRKKLVDQKYFIEDDFTRKGASR
jgi:restriction endonuclease S subunit